LLFLLDLCGIIFHYSIKFKKAYFLKNEKNNSLRYVRGGMNSLRQALKNHHLLENYCVYTFDIVPKSNGFKNIVIDLAQDQLIVKLNQLIKNKIIKKPDIIVCSPLCQSFSVAMQSISTLKDKNEEFFSGNPHHY